jgi:hypothetical protein
LKSLLKRKFIIMPIIVVIVVLAMVGIVLAANSIMISGKVNVVPATYDIAIFQDSTLKTQLPQPLVWSDLPTGEKRSKTVYIENTGNCDALVVATLQSPPAGITLDTASTVVPRLSSAPMTLTLEATPQTSLGAKTITIGFTSTQNNLVTTTTTTTTP